MEIFMYSMPYTSSLNGTSISKTGGSSELKLQYKKGLYYELGKDTPFTGKMRVNYEKEYINNEGNSIIREASFENEYVDGVKKIQTTIVKTVFLNIVLKIYRRNYLSDKQLKIFSYLSDFFLRKSYIFLK